MTTTTIDVETLPKKPGSKKNQTRRTFTPQERVQIVGRIRKAINGGATIHGACKEVGLAHSVYRKWIEDKKQWLAAAPAKKANGHISEVAVCIMFKVRDNLVELTPEEARHVHARLGALLAT